jgi:hypothetical protein
LVLWAEGARLAIGAMIRIAISAAAFEAIASTLPLGFVSFESEPNAKGERFVCLVPIVVNRLRAPRRPGESYSDVILRVAGLQAQSKPWMDPRLAAINLAASGQAPVAAPAPLDMDLVEDAFPRLARNVTRLTDLKTLPLLW